MTAPTVGRKIYYYPDAGSFEGKQITQLDPNQPINATVLFIHPKNTMDAPDKVSLHIVDHTGIIHFRAAVPLVEGDTAPPSGGYAKWMPYQVTQHAKNESAAPDAAATQPSSDASASPATTEAPVTATPIPAPAPTASEAVTAAVQETVEVLGAVQYGFDVALNALKAGKAITRKGWNGKGMFVYMVPAASYRAQTGIAKKVFGEDALVPYNAYLALKGADGNVSTWVPSVNDCLAVDWEISQ